jgi:sugar phosphate isomerase/epimerase
MNANGYRFYEESVNLSFSPRNVSDSQFQKNLSSFKRAKLKLYSCNAFIPGSLKLVGPVVNESAVLGYVDTVLRRCREAGVKIVVLGSGEARRIPAGYDSVKASKEFIALVRKMAGLAAGYGIIIAIENLNHTETNFVLSLQQAIEIVKAVDRPSFRLTADIYHMLMENEPASDIEQAGGLLVHCHIAEKIDRAYPGKTGVDFMPYFKAMKKIGFHGKIMIECRWGNFDQEIGPARNYLLNQLTSAN